MIRKLTIAHLWLLFACVGVGVEAADPAATSDLPAGLQAIGVKSTEVVSAKAAHAVRGQSLVPYLEQSKSFTVTGATLGTGSTVNLLEGVIGQATMSTTSAASGTTTTTTLEVLFGGLSGTIGFVGGELNFNLAGKSLQETLKPQGGQFSQDFHQIYKLLP